MERPANLHLSSHHLKGNGTDTERKTAKPTPSLPEAEDRAERARQVNPRIVPDPTQRQRPQGETDSDDEPEWPRTESDTDLIKHWERRLEKAVDDADLPPKKAAAILKSIKLPAPRRQSPYGTKAAVTHPPAKPRKRKGDDDKATSARKPVLVLVLVLVLGR